MAQPRKVLREKELGAFDGLKPTQRAEKIRNGE
jgi:hypothetical protein